MRVTARTSRILDAYGRPQTLVMHAPVPAYDSAGRGPRFRGMGENSGSANAVLANSLGTIRRRSHDAYRKNPYVSGGVESLVANGVGTGVRPRVAIRDEGARKDVHDAFDRWTDEADADGLLNFYGQQALGLRTVQLGGEVIARYRSRLPKDGLTVPLQLQLLEGDFCPIEKNETLGNGVVIRAGIEFDAINRRSAMHLFRSHPGEPYPLGLGGGLDTVRVPMTELAHMFWPIRPGQLRGVPWLQSVLLRLHDLDSYEDAEMVRKKTAAMFALFVTRERDAQQSSPLGEEDDDGDGRALIDVVPGSATVLYPGENIAASEPVDVGQSFEPFMKHMLRAIARGMGLTYEQLTGDLRGVNYSSIRAGLLEFRRWCEMVVHAMLVHQLCRPTWQRWAPLAALAGAFSGNAARDLRLLRKYEREFSSPRWIPQGWKWVDPVTEVDAHLKAIGGGLESRPDAVAELGYDYETIDEENAAAAKNAARLGLSYSFSTSATPAASASSNAAAPSSERPANSPDAAPGDAANAPDAAPGDAAEESAA